MPSLKVIRTRIVSVKSTQKITKAMKMVAGARLARAQQAITALRPYAVKTGEILQSVAGGAAADESAAGGAGVAEEAEGGGRARREAGRRCCDGGIRLRPLGFGAAAFALRKPEAARLSSSRLRPPPE